METYTNGLCFKTKKDITKNDIITLIHSLNNNNYYLNLCEFIPEGISEGGILFKFKDDFDKEWYKSVRLGIRGNGKWDWIDENVMSEWHNNDDIIFKKNIKFTTFLKSFHGAPIFTLDELKIWEECFKQIGIVRFGRYPSKKSLIN